MTNAKWLTKRPVVIGTWSFLGHWSGIGHWSFAKVTRSNDDELPWINVLLEGGMDILRCQRGNALFHLDLVREGATEVQMRDDLPRDRRVAGPAHFLSFQVCLLGVFQLRE